MNRRACIALLGAAAVWPFAARAQQRAVPVVGVLSSGSPEAFAPRVSALREGLRETGYDEGRNVALEFRWAEGRYDRLPALAAELVERKPAVIATIGGTPAALPAKAATSVIPVVFQVGGDPVELGLVASIGRPGGNLTGVTSLGAELAPKQLEVLHEITPAATAAALLVNPTNPAITQGVIEKMREAARIRGLELQLLHASSQTEF
jgi:putative ABC transport system substrate-binding protein